MVANSPTRISAEANPPITTLSPSYWFQQSPFNAFDIFGRESPQLPQCLSQNYLGFFLLWDLPWLEFQHRLNGSTAEGDNARLGNERTFAALENPALESIDILRDLIAPTEYTSWLSNSDIMSKFKSLAPREATLPVGWESPQASTAMRICGLAVFMATNNMMNCYTVSNLVTWALSHNFQNLLFCFLDSKGPTSTTWGQRVMEAAIALEIDRLVEALWKKGVSIEYAVERLLQIDGLVQFSPFVLSKLSLHRLSTRGRRLLFIKTIEKGDVMASKRLIEAGINVNALHQAGAKAITPLAVAVESHNKRLVELLVVHGAHINTTFTNYRGCEDTALSVAINLKFTRIAKYLLRHGARTDYHINGEPIVSFAQRWAPKIYGIMKNLGLSQTVTVNDILAAALSPEDFSNLLADAQISADIAMVAWLEGLNRRVLFKVSINLIQQGPLRGYSEALATALRCNGLQIAGRAKLARILLRDGANPNIPKLLDGFIKQEFRQHFQQRKKVDDKWIEEVDAITDLLIEYGYDVTEHGPSAAETALIYCFADRTRRMSQDIVFSLIDRGVAINAYGDSLTAVQAAAWQGSLIFLRCLLLLGGEINKEAHHSGGLTALQAASLSRSLRKVRFLVAHGADVNAPPAAREGMTALEASVRPYSYVNAGQGFSATYREEGKNTKYGIQIFRFLLNNGAATERQDGSNSPLLHDIIKRGLTYLLKEALEAGAQQCHFWGTSYPSFHLVTPMQLAAGRNNLEAIEILISHGGDCNAAAAPDYGRTALQAASGLEEINMSVIKLLLSNGADVNAPPAARGGVTALQAAAIQGHLNLAILLIENGANVNALPAASHGRTAIEGAAEHGRLDMVQLLINAGVSGESFPSGGFEKAVDFALDNKHFAIAELLKKRR